MGEIALQILGIIIVAVYVGDKVDAYFAKVGGYERV